MLTYSNDQKLKDGLLKEITWHRKQDMIQKGTYGHQNGTWKGCAIACSLRSLDKVRGRELRIEYSSHKAFEKELWPEWLARLEDAIFEGLPEEKVTKWPGIFAKAMPVGVDYKNLDVVKWKFTAFILRGNIERVQGLKISDELKVQVVDAIKQCLALQEDAIKTGKWNGSAARSARSAAWSAARSAEWSAWSEWSARSAAYEMYADELIRLLKSVK